MSIPAGSGVRCSRAKAPNRLAVPIGRRKLRLCVLPFFSAEPTNDASLAVAVSDTVATRLRQFHWLEVISVESWSLHDSGIPDEAERSGFSDYIVEGAVSAVGNRAQVNIRLVDLADCARTLWSRHFLVQVRKLSDWSNLVSHHIIAGIDPATSFFDGHPQRRKRSGADGLLMAAIPLMSSLERRKYEEAGRLIERASDIDPENATVAAWAAFWQVVYFGQGWTQNFAKASAIAQTRARRAITLKPDDAETLAICGHVNSFLGRDYDSALYYFGRAQHLDPTLEFAWLWSALTYCYAGNSGAALERLEQYRSLISTEPSHAWVLNIYSVANVFAGNYEKAVISARRGIGINPTFVNAYKPLIASLGHLGRVEEAKPYVDKLLALEPNFSLERFAKVYPIKYDSDREHYVKGLRLAGIPER
jgi:TolB-like protein